MRPSPERRRLVALRVASRSKDVDPRGGEGKRLWPPCKL